MTATQPRRHYTASHNGCLTSNVNGRIHNRMTKGGFADWVDYQRRQGHTVTVVPHGTKIAAPIED